MSENTILLTGSERDAYIAERFQPTQLETESHDAEVTMQAQSEFAAWYDSKSEEYQFFIDSISNRTYFIIDEDEYDNFIEELANYGINDAEQFDDAFEGEWEGYGERVISEFSEELIELLGYTIEPDFIARDYQTIEFKGNTYFFRNI